MHKSLGLFAESPPNLFVSGQVWFSEFSRNLLEMIGIYLTLLSANEIEYILREILSVSTFPFRQG